MQSRTISFGGASLSYRFRWAQGSKLVFIHGFCEDSRMWDGFLEPFGKYACLLPDLPGFGASGLLDSVSIADMAEAVKAMLDDVGWERCTLVGHSMGGYVSMAFAERYGQMLEGLCLFHSHPYADTEEKKANRIKGIAFVEENGPERYVAQLIPKLFHRRMPEVEQKLIAAAQQYLPKGIQNALQAMAGRPDRSEVLRRCKLPVAFIVGGQDAAVSLEYSMKQCLLPAVAYVEYLREVGHMGMFEDPERCQKFLLSYLQSEVG